jgi:hypothetical protein
MSMPFGTAVNLPVAGVEKRTSLHRSLPVKRMGQLMRAPVLEVHARAVPLMPALTLSPGLWMLLLRTALSLIPHRVAAVLLNCKCHFCCRGKVSNYQSLALKFVVFISKWRCNIGRKYRVFIIKRGHIVTSI